MQQRLRLFLLRSAALLGGIAGCCGSGRHCGYFPTGPIGSAPCPNCGPAAPPPSRFGPAAALPPAPALGNPLPPGPPSGSPLTPNPTPPPPVDPQAGAFNPPPADIPPAPPPDAGVRLSAPEPIQSYAAAAPPSWSPGGSRAERPPETAPRQWPQTVEPPIASIPPQKEPPANPPPARDEGGATPPLPVDIPQFALARPRVASGQQPFPDGVAWLKAHGYRAVLHVRAPGTDDSAARRQFEKHGLTYYTLEVSPRTLTKEVVDQFNRTVTDEANLPLFVYDRDSSLAGGLWYLYYRLVEKLDDGRARTEAARLGFKQDQDGDHRSMWLAVQNFLAAQNP